MRYLQLVVLTFCAAGSIGCSDSTGVSPSQCGPQTILTVGSGLKPLISWKNPPGYSPACAADGIGVWEVSVPGGQQIELWSADGDASPIRYGSTAEGSTRVFDPLVAGHSYIARLFHRHRLEMPEGGYYFTRYFDVEVDFIATP